MNAVIYARYSDSKQGEGSIEGQLKVCNEYAKREGLNVLNEYIDRGISGRTDDRPQFQKMIKDSGKKHFEQIIVYQLDRFARNRYDNAHYKNILKKNGVVVTSARENISDDASGIIMESVLVGMAEYYSVELGQKVRRGSRINAEKGLSNGGTTPLGYKIVDKKYVINEETAPIVKEVFYKYANGATMKEICDSLNERQLKSSKKAAFNKGSLQRMLSNRKYLGFYIYEDIIIEGGMPQIIEQDLFDKVQEKLILNKKAPGRARAKAEYLLTTKLFCGHCKTMMIGHSSNQISKKGVIFNYYKCKNQGKDKPCKKKMVHKNYIEDIVVNECKKLLTPKNIQRIAKEVVRIAESYDDRAEIIRLEGLLMESQEARDNQMTTLRACKDDTVKEMIVEDLGRIGAEMKILKQQLEVEATRHYGISEKQIANYLTNLAEGDINNPVYRKSLVSLLVNKIFLYDDRFTVTFNSGDEEVTISDVLLEDIEKSLCLINGSAHQFSFCEGNYIPQRFQTSFIGV